MLSGLSDLLFRHVDGRGHEGVTEHLGVVTHPSHFVELVYSSEGSIYSNAIQENVLAPRPDLLY